MKLEKLISSLKVLIVDDNRFNIIPISATLKKNRIEFDIAKNGLMAVDRYVSTMKEGYVYFKLSFLIFHHHS